jgi:hypothetical protein
MTRMTRILKIAFGNFIFRHLKIFEYSKIAAEGSKKIRVIRVIRVPKNPRHPRHPRSKKSASSASSAFPKKIRVIRVIRVPKKNPRHPRHPRSPKKIRVPTRVPKKSAFLPAFPSAFQKKFAFLCSVHEHTSCASFSPSSCSFPCSNLRHKPAII